MYGAEAAVVASLLAVMDETRVWVLMMRLSYLSIKSFHVPVMRRYGQRAPAW